MSGIWLDEGYAEHPKVVGLSDHAFSMEIRAMCYTARNATDGVIPDGSLRLLTTSGSPREVAGELVAAGRWHRADAPCPQGHEDTCPTMTGEGWRIHDYLDHNSSTEQQRARRAAGATRMRRSRARQRAAPQRDQLDPVPAAGGQFSQDGRPDGTSEAVTEPSARPPFIRPVRSGQQPSARSQ